MRAIFRRLSPWGWVLMFGAFTGNALYTSWVDRRLTPGRIAADVLLGVTATFLFAWGAPFATRVDARIKRLFSRRPR